MKPINTNNQIAVHTFLFIPVIILCLILTSCIKSQRQKDIEEIKKLSDNFALNYFNFDFISAQKHCTPESYKWLSFIASNIQQEDIDIINSQENKASVETKHVEFINDTTATASCRVSNFLKLDTLGQTGQITETAEFNICIIKRNNRWLVKMEDLLRNETQNHD